MAQETNIDLDELIDKVAKRIVEAGMEAPAILALEGARPLATMGSQMGRVMIAPWFGIFGWDAMTKADNYMALFEDKNNVKKLVQKIEDLAGISNRSEKKRKGK
jgi:hypothetical protein